MGIRNLMVFNLKSKKLLSGGSGLKFLVSKLLSCLPLFTQQAVRRHLIWDVYSQQMSFPVNG
jgi:hypothetical protein